MMMSVDGFVIVFILFLAVGLVEAVKAQIGGRRRR